MYISRKRPVATTMCLIAAFVSLAGCSSSSSISSPTQASSNATGSGANQSASATKGSLIATAIQGFSPAYIFKDGKWTGYYVDLERAAARLLGYELEFTSVDFSAEVPGVQSGKFDVGSTLSPTEERLKVIDVVPLVQAGNTFIVLKSSGLTVSGPLDLCGKKMAMNTGDSTRTYVTAFSAQCTAAGKPAIDIQNTPDGPSQLLSVKSKHVDLATFPTTSASTAIKADPTLTVVPFTYAQQIVGIGFKKGSSLATDFNAAINKIIADGTYMKILAQYGLESLAISHATLNALKVDEVYTPSASASTSK